jgi:hypothetical protein
LNGKKSNQVVISGNDFSRIRQIYELKDDATASAIMTRYNRK